MCPLSSGRVSSAIMEALKPEHVRRRSCTSRRTPTPPHTGGSRDLAHTDHLFRAPDWRRRAGEWTNWEGLEEEEEEGYEMSRPLRGMEHTPGSSMDNLDSSVTGEPHRDYSFRRHHAGLVTAGSDSNVSCGPYM